MAQNGAGIGKIRIRRVGVDKAQNGRVGIDKKQNGREGFKRLSSPDPANILICWDERSRGKLHFLADLGHKIFCLHGPKQPSIHY